MQAKLVVVSVSVVLLQLSICSAAPVYRDTVVADGPVAYWRLNETTGVYAPEVGASPALDGTVAGSNTAQVDRTAAGPRPPAFAGFESTNNGPEFDGAGEHIVIDDPGTDSVLDFGLNDEITLEAWVNVNSISNDGQDYIIAKGRTDQGDAAHNYGLRVRDLAGDGSSAHISFLYRNDSGGWGGRWQTTANFTPGDGQWHHLVVTYTFGDASSIVGYIDGVASGGSWDLGGNGADTPVQSNAQLWLAGSSGSGDLDGQIDEIAIYDRALSATEVAEHYNAAVPEPASALLAIFGVAGLLGWRCTRRRTA